MMSLLKVLFSRCLAEFYLPHAAKSVNDGVERQDAVIMFKIRLTLLKTVGEFERSWHNVPLASDTSDKNQALLASGLKMTRQEHKDGNTAADTTGPMAAVDVSQAPESPQYAAAAVLNGSRSRP